MNWKLKAGNFLFRYRSFTPVPLIIAVFLFFRPGFYPRWNILTLAAGTALLCAGELIRIVSVGYSSEGTSGRESFLRADDLNTTGIYSVIRNPLYIGNILMYTGLLTVYSNMYALLLFDILLIIQYYFIILSEENFLESRYGKEYAVYKKNVHSILPDFKSRKKPANRFDLLKVVYKENDSVFNSLVILIIILVYRDSIMKGEFHFRLLFGVVVSILSFIYIVIKIFKSSKRP